MDVRTGEKKKKKQDKRDERGEIHGTNVRTLLACSQRHFQSFGGHAFSCGVVEVRHASRMLSWDELVSTQPTIEVLKEERGL
jgi:hypothetical protein